MPSTATSAPIPTTPTSHRSRSFPTPASPSPSYHPAPPTTPSRSSSSSSYSHPYAIQSTASSVLTRSNSSPAKSPVPLAHRPSRSMSSLHNVLEGPSVTTPSGAGAVGAASASSVGGRYAKPKSLKELEEERRRSLDSPSASGGTRPGARRSGTLPDFLMGSGGREKRVKEVELPMNPKLWTPSELAQYLAYELRTGGVDGTGKVLPAPLVEDIKVWVLRQQVSGKTFLTGSSDGWGSTTRPPPFLPLLQSIARSLRRNSLSLPFPHTHPHHADDTFTHEPTLLEETDEDDGSDDGEDGPTGVKRMIIAYDARSSASEASGDESDASASYHPAELKPQHTGESVVERWKRWEEKGEERYRSPREYNGSPIVGVSGGGGYVYGLEKRRRNVSDASDGSDLSTGSGSMGDVENSPTMEQALLEAEAHGVVLEEGDDLGDGTIKAVPPNPSTASSSALPKSALPGLTPPPPYTSTFGDDANPATPSHLTPQRVHSSREGHFSVTPTPERPRQVSTSTSAAATGLRITASSPDTTPSKTHPSDSPHAMTNMAQHLVSGANPYGTLGRTSSGRRRFPESRPLGGVGESDEGEGEEEGRWETARRVTIRPSRAGAQSLFTQDDAEEERKREEEAAVKVEKEKSEKAEEEREKEKERKRKEQMEEQMAKLIERIKELETKLDAVTAPPSAATSAAGSIGSAAGNELARARARETTLLDMLGWGKGEQEDDGLPTRVKELPAYLFLVGVGVGAVMVRVFFGRR
ncbi:hypothetical protein IAT38_002446 [Cryptococcus sp. DSM 104549]